jgi:hypothetical protein
MSQENVEFVKRVHAAFNRDGVEAVLSGMPPDQSTSAGRLAAFGGDGGGA